MKGSILNEEGMTVSKKSEGRKEGRNGSDGKGGRE